MTTLKAETLRALAEKATQEDDDARYYGGPPPKHLPHGIALDIYLRNAVPEILALLEADKDERVAQLERALSNALDAMEPSGACNGNGIVYREGLAALKGIHP